MKAWFALFLCFTFLPLAAAFAQQPADQATKEDVQQLFELTKSKKQFDSIITIMKQQIPAMNEELLKKQAPDATTDDLAKLNAFTAGTVDKMFNGMPFDEMMQAMIPSYQRHFSHAEMQQIIQFYSSPAGSKMIAEMPSIMAEGMEASMPILMKWMETQQAELKARSEEFAKTLKEKKTHSAAPKVKPAS